MNILRIRAFRSKDAKWLTVTRWLGMDLNIPSYSSYSELIFTGCLLCVRLYSKGHTLNSHIGTISPTLGMKKLRHQKVTKYLNFAQVASSKAKISNTAGSLQSLSACWWPACLKYKKRNYTNKLY